MPLLQSDIAAGSQAWTNIQRNQLEQQYMPQHFDAQMTHEVQANQLQKANIDKLQATMVGDKALQKNFTEVFSKPENQNLTASEKMAKVMSLAAAEGTATPAAIEAVAKIADTMSTHESQAAERKAKIREKTRQEQLDILSGYDPKDPVAVQEAILAATKKGVLPPGFSDLVSKVGAEKAWEMATNGLKTEAQRDRDVRMVEEKRKTKEAEADRDAERSRRAARDKADEALRRDNLELRKETKKTNDTAEKRLKLAEDAAKRAKAKDETRLIEDHTFEVTKARKEYEAKFKELDKTDLDAAKALQADYAQQIETINDKTRREWRREEHQGTPYQTEVPSKFRTTKDDEKDASEVKPILEKASKDPAMKGNTFGKLTAKGVEVFKDGKLIGYYK